MSIDFNSFHRPESVSRITGRSKWQMSPIPETGTNPNRVLLNHWSEYIHFSGRKYYYNSVTKQSSWKPPRRGLSIWFCKYDDSGGLYFLDENEDRSHWHLPDLITDEESDRECQSQSDASECYSPITKDLPDNDNGNSASFSSPSTVSRFKNDGSLRLPIRKNYVNDLSPIERSFKAKSMVFLPTGDKFVNIDSDLEERSSTTTINETFSNKSSNNNNINNNNNNNNHHHHHHQNRNHNYHHHHLHNHYHNSSFNHNLNSHHTPIPPVPENLEESRAFKTGIMNRTKIMENGKRLRKNWSTSLVALTDHYLLIFKDAKINSHQEENLKPEIAVELGGSLIEWSQGLSSRKNVFQLTTFTGNQILLQEDCSLTAAEWFYSIKSAISKLPKCDGTATIGTDSLESNKECKLKRSKSTKQSCKKIEINQKVNTKNGPVGDDKITPEKNKKIRERLINFLLRRPTLDSLREKGIFKDEPVFGCDLYSLCSREKQLVPKVVQQCIKAIEQKGLRADGIYRVCGNLSEVQKIRYQVNHDDYEGIWAQEDVHVLTGALKLFFRDMKEPLFPCNRFDSLMFTIGLPDKKKKQEAIVRVIRDLPKCNKETLKYLLKHLLRVQDHKDENRMHIQNLAIVFGPTLMWPETDSNNLAYDMMLKMHSNQVIELLLLEFENIFR